MWRRFWLWFVIVGLLLTAGRASAAEGKAEALQEKSYSADRFDVDIVVREDGSLLVTETVVYRFVGEPFTFVFRELETDWSDGIGELTAAVDGRVYPPGEAAGQVEISGQNPLRVEWHFEPTRDTTRTFTLTYVMYGVARQEDGFDLLRFQPLPDEFAFPIADSTVTITYPFRAALESEPVLEAGSGIISQSNNQVTIVAQDIQPNQTMVIEMPFTAGSLISAPPQWQQNEIFSQSLVPVWLISSGAVLLAGIVGVFTLWRREQPHIPTGRWTIDSPPGKLPVGLSGAITATGATPAWHHALGTLFDLAARGYVEIEEIPKKGWFSTTDFMLRQIKSEEGLLPHESGLLGMIFTDKKTGRVSEIKMSKLRGIISSTRWKKYSEVIKAEIKAAGYLSVKRQQVRRQFYIIGALIAALALVSFVLTLIVIARTGAWPFILSLALFLTGVMFLMAGASFSPLTDEAAGIASDWKRYFAYLKDVTKGRATVTHELFEPYLPYAAAAGILPNWVKWFEKQGKAALPPYFHLTSSTPSQGFVAFAALAASSTTSGGAAAGAGGGAAGGGAAGAG